jgi:hypothetical protein
MSGPVEDAASKYGRLGMLATGHLVDTLVMSDMDESPLKKATNLIQICLLRSLIAWRHRSNK